MAHEFRHIRRVEFSDTDMAGIVHFSRFFLYLESAEHAFYRSLGFSVHATIDGQPIAWPRVSVSCDYKKPLRFEDEVETHLVIRDIQRKTIRYDVTFSKLGTEGNELVATGSLTIVCITFTGDGMKSIQIPESIRSHLEVAPD